MKGAITATNSGCKVRIIGPKDKVTDPSAIIVNTTSRSKEQWSIGLSPFFLGPVELYDGLTALNMENAWQYSKVYWEHIDPETGEPTDAYWQWAKEGWANPKAVRFPMGRGARPEYSLWQGQKLDYIAARKQIYAPLYARCVEQTESFQRLKRLYETTDEKKTIYLWDFDGYDHVAMGRDLREVLNDPRKKMGHSFVLLMMLRGERLWETDDIPSLQYDPKLRKEPEIRVSVPNINVGLLLRSGSHYLLCRSAWRESSNDEEEDQEEEHEAEEGQWGIPKGFFNMHTDHGNAHAVALQHFAEQTGLDLASLLPATATSKAQMEASLQENALGKGKRKKTTRVFCIHDEAQEGEEQSIKRKTEDGRLKLECSAAIEGDYVPLAVKGKPKVDAYRWATAEEAANLVFYSLRFLFSSDSSSSSSSSASSSSAESK